MRSDRMARYVDLLLAVVVLLGIASVGYADFTAKTVSLGFLYIFPLVTSAMFQSQRTSIVLALVCVALRDLLEPFDYTGFDLVLRTFLTTVGYLFVVIVVYRMASQRRRLNEVVKQQRDELAREMTQAAEVQQRLLPQGSLLVKGLDIAARMYPSKIVGGDFYDLVSLPGNETAFLIGDVSGKGVAAGLLMAAVGATLRAEAPRAASPDGLLTKVNEILLQTTTEGRYASLFFASIAEDVMLLEYTNGGHPPPVLYRPASNEIHWLEKGGPVVGLLLDVSYDRASVPLQAGDVLLLYTDGLTEALNVEEQEYSQANIVSCLSKSAHLSSRNILEEIRTSVVDFHGGEHLDDDMTLVVVKIVG